MFRDCVFAGFAGLFLSGCALLAVVDGNRGIDKPPYSEAGARKWWEETIDRVDIDTLQSWHQASEYHRQRGSSATYLRSQYCGHNMIGPWYHDQYYPTPMPNYVMARVTERLTNEKIKDGKSADWVSVDSFRKCTKQEAADAWKRREK